jgi:hypothetical protein
MSWLPTPQSTARSPAKRVRIDPMGATVERPPASSFGSRMAGGRRAPLLYLPKTLVLELAWISTQRDPLAALPFAAQCEHFLGRPPLPSATPSAFAGLSWTLANETANAPSSASFCCGWSSTSTACAATAAAAGWDVPGLIDTGSRSHSLRQTWRRAPSHTPCSD